MTDHRTDSVVSTPSGEQGAFTMVFEGDIRDHKPNPYLTDTPFGRCYAIAVGDMLQQLDILENALKEIERSSSDYLACDIALKALYAADVARKATSPSRAAHRPSTEGAKPE